MRVDITQLILDDHHEQRRLFAVLEQIERTDVPSLTAVWKHLAAVLETHAEAEERHFYPALLRVGKGAGGKRSSRSETTDAIKDHNEIRAAVRSVQKQRVGTKAWFGAVTAADKANGDHMAEEEREGLSDFRRHATLKRRHELAVAFVVFEALHVTGVRPKDKSPTGYVRARQGRRTSSRKTG